MQLGRTTANALWWIHTNSCTNSKKSIGRKEPDAIQIEARLTAHKACEQPCRLPRLPSYARMLTYVQKINQTIF